MHSVLPANGAPVSRQRTSRVKEMYTEYVREKTLHHWKFWIVIICILILFMWNDQNNRNFNHFYLQLGLIFEPLLNSYNTTVSVASMEELYRSAMIWVDQHCSLVEIRPGKHQYDYLNFIITFSLLFDLIIFFIFHFKLFPINYVIYRQQPISYQIHHQHYKTRCWRLYRPAHRAVQQVFCEQPRRCIFSSGSTYL